MSRFTEARSACTPLSLGASLYVPATHAQLYSVLQGERIEGLRSVIICTEDAIRGDELPEAVRSIKRALAQLGPGGPRRFIRPRNLDVLQDILDAPSAALLDGVVLPKASATQVQNTLDLLRAFPSFWVMPILETKEVFDHGAMREFAAMLSHPSVRPHILAARIGGNDLLRCLGLRRDRSTTIYSTPIGTAIAQLATTFLPAGISLSAPVFDDLENSELLASEIRTDLAHGLSGKSAVHPRQLGVIEAGYRVSAEELAMAEAVLAPTASAVFPMSGTMCETAVHAPWAYRIRERARLFGVSDGSSA